MAAAAPIDTRVLYGPIFGASVPQFMNILKDIKEKMHNAIAEHPAYTQNMSSVDYLRTFDNVINIMKADAIKFNAVDPGALTVNAAMRTTNIIVNPNAIDTTIRHAGHKTIDGITANNINYATARGIDTYNIKKYTDQEEIQNRINGCYVLEGLYIKKHNELIKMFSFTRLLYNKFNYTLKILLYVLSLLSAHICPIVPEPIPVPFTIKLPTPLITNINQLLIDQKSMMDAINTADTGLKKNGPLNFNNIDPAVNELKTGALANATRDAINIKFPNIVPQ